MSAIDESELIPLAQLATAAECLRVLAHPVRLRIVELLTRGEFSVHQLATLCHIAPNQACGHLRLMKSHGLLTCRRAGRTVYYVVCDGRLPEVLACLRRHCHAPPTDQP